MRYICGYCEKTFPRSDCLIETIEGGKEKTCPDCGMGLFKERWSLLQRLELADVNTYALSIPHGRDRQYHYESLVSHPRTSDLIANRYETKQEAIDGHEELVGKIKAEKFSIVPETYRLKIHDDQTHDG